MREINFSREIEVSFFLEFQKSLSAYKVFENREKVKSRFLAKNIFSNRQSPEDARSLKDFIKNILHYPNVIIQA